MSPVVDYDPAEKLRAYAYPERLVTTGWLAEHLEDPDLVVAESDEDVLLYETGHIPGAVKLDWHTDLNDPVTRDYVDGEGFARLMSAKGISRDTTIVFYGDKSNWWAAYALWVCTLFGHEDVRLLDGGRQVDPGGAAPDHRGARAATHRVSGGGARRQDHPGLPRRRAGPHRHRGPAGGCPLPQEFSGELLAMPDYPQEGALRGGPP
jgi:thiosulfate/3-mercaptopyruvate sulfurtransferase